MASETFHKSQTEEQNFHSKALSVQASDSQKAAREHDSEVNEEGPIKGDMSDGRVDWTFKQVAATIALCGLYVGGCRFYVIFRQVLIRFQDLRFRCTLQEVLSPS